MDEILIEDKKYISSKQAAKVTGYAKDYIGQLCREGRVPARLVGRSWYVLESAIQDHRFGDHDDEIKTSKAPIDKTPVQTSSPRYEPDEHEELPVVNRSRPSSDDAEASTDREFEQSKQLHDAWGAWFDRISTSEGVTNTEMATSAEEQIPPQEIVEESVTEDQATIVPIHSLQQDLAPTEPLSAQTKESVTQVEHGIKQAEEGIKPSKMDVENRKIRVLSVVAITISTIIAIPLLIIAIVSTGYFDNILSGYDELQSISGIKTYNSQVIK